MIVVIALLAAAGIVLEVRRRRPAGLLLLIPMAAVAALLAPQLSPYAGGKLLVVLSPAVVLMAAIGGFALLAQRVRWIQVVCGAGADGHDRRRARVGRSGLSPGHPRPSGSHRRHDRRGRPRNGGGLWLVNEWEEFAKYFMRDIKVNAAFEAESPRPAEMRKPRPIFGRYYDLDALTLEYMDSFPGIIKRRSPEASRPPASFKLSYANDYYEVWRRQDSPAVIEHLPLQRRHTAAATPGCAAVRALASRARPATG